MITKEELLSQLYDIYASAPPKFICGSTTSLLNCRRCPYSDSDSDIIFHSDPIPVCYKSLHDDYNTYVKLKAWKKLNDD